MSYPQGFSNNNTDLHAAGYRAAELFAGIGGFATAWPEVFVTAAIDIDRRASAVYAANFKHKFLVREIETISACELIEFKANLWWMSPPCQPYTHRGQQRDVDDPRARSFLRLIEMLGECTPDFLLLENVLGFAKARAQQLLVSQLNRFGYRWQSIEFCPTQLNWPNRRPRYFLIASRGNQVAAWREFPKYSSTARDLIDRDLVEQFVAPELLVDDSRQKSIESGMDRFELYSGRPTACFASSYGRALLKSGSYVRLVDGGYRRFSPREVANFLGFPASFRLPENCNTRTLWNLLGNSLCLPAVRYVLSHLPNGPTAKLPWWE